MEIISLRSGHFCEARETLAEDLNNFRCFLTEATTARSITRVSERSYVLDLLYWAGIKLETL